MHGFLWSTKSKRERESAIKSEADWTILNFYFEMENL